MEITVFSILFTIAAMIGFCYLVKYLNELEFKSDIDMAEVNKTIVRDLNTQQLVKRGKLQ